MRSFRVLVVVRSAEGRDDFAEWLLETQPRFWTMILVTTHADCVRDPLGDILMTAAGYKETVPDHRVKESARLCSLCE